MKHQSYQTPTTEVIEIGTESTVLITSDLYNNPNSLYDPDNNLGVI